MGEKTIKKGSIDLKKWEKPYITAIDLKYTKNGNWDSDTEGSAWMHRYGS